MFARKPIFGYTTLIYATMAIGAPSGRWAHHMFATGAVLLPFFSFMTYLIAVPTGIKFFNWIGTMWKGQLTFETPMLFCGRLPGHVPARRSDRSHAGQPADRLPRHRQLFRGGAFPLRALRHHRVRDVRRRLLRFPKMTGRLLDERLGKLHFWLTFIGFHTTFPVQHWLGDYGMPRRYADYLPSDGFTPLNVVSTIGAFTLGVSMLPFVWNVFKSWRYGEPVMVDDPWGYGNSLEWATSCPPPRHNFTELPRIRSSARHSSCTTRTWSSGCATSRMSHVNVGIPSKRPTSRAGKVSRSRHGGLGGVTECPRQR